MDFTFVKLEDDSVGFISMRKIILFLILAVSHLVFGQACTTRVLVNVFDAKTGRVMPDLRPEYFQAKAGKTPLIVDGIEPIKNNRILVLVDASGGAEEPKVAESVNTIADVTRQAPAEMPVAFGIFGERAFLPHEFASNPKTVNAQIDEIMAHLSSSSLGKYPALFDALHEALALFGEPEPGDTILLVSRGLNYGSKRSAKDLAREFSNAGVRLLVMTGEHLTQPQKNASSEWYADERSSTTWYAGSGTVHLLKIAEQTGGSLVGFIGPRWFSAAAVGYTLRLQSPSSFIAAKSWSLEFTKAAQNAVGQVRLVRPRQLPPCTTVGSAH